MSHPALETCVIQEVALWACYEERLKNKSPISNSYQEAVSYACAYLSFTSLKEKKTLWIWNCAECKMLYLHVFKKREKDPRKRGEERKTKFETKTYLQNGCFLCLVQRFEDLFHWKTQLKTNKISNKKAKIQTMENNNKKLARTWINFTFDQSPQLICSTEAIAPRKSWRQSFHSCKSYGKAEERRPWYAPAFKPTLTLFNSRFGHLHLELRLSPINDKWS